MKRMMIIGPVAAGKTSLIQSLKGEKLHYRKTQAIEFDDRVIDTPGEYMENRDYLCALTVTACDADVVIFVQDASSDALWYSPGQACMFSAKVIGVVTKIDAASKAQIGLAKEALKIAGAESVIAVSNVDRRGIEELLTCLGKEETYEMCCDT